MVDIWEVMTDFDGIWRTLDEDGSGIVDQSEMTLNNQGQVFDGLAFGGRVFKVTF